MTQQFNFRCGSCNVRLRASSNFLGRSCNCPKCGNLVKVILPTPDDELPVLVFDDGHSRKGRFGAR